MRELKQKYGRGIVIRKWSKSRGNSYHVFWVLGILLIAFLIILPLLTEPYYAGHDTKYHLANVSSIESQILNGNIPTNVILDKIGYGLGYASRLFYPPLSHTITAYFSAILSIFHFTVIDGFKLVHFLVLFLSGITMYFLSFRLSDNKKIAFFSALIYMIFPYHISDIYVRDSLAECFLFPFLPMIFLGVYELLEGNISKFFPLFIVGYVGAILSHFTLMIYFTLLIIIFLLISRKTIFKKEIFFPFLIACISIVGITLFFTVGLLENRILGDYVVFEVGEMTKRISKTALYPFEYLNIIPSLQSKIKFYIPVTLILLIGFTFLKRKKIEFPKYTKNFLVVGVIAFFLSTKLFPWKIVPYFFQMIQFPWRFEIFICLIISIFAPLCLKNVRWKRINILCTLLLLLSAYWAIEIPSEEVISLENIWWNGGMGWQKEYLPIVAKQNKDYIKSKKQTLSFEEGEGTYKVIESQVPELTFQVTTQQPVILELPRIYYPGYQLVGDNGQKVPLTMSKYGLLQTRQIESGTYHLTYPGTTLMQVAKKISLITVIVSTCGYLYICQKKNTSWKMV